jgi:hypothetical protein
MMELVRIDSKHFPSIFPDGFTDRIFTDARLKELPLYHESFYTSSACRTINNSFALPLKIRERIYRQYELTVFAKESMRVDQLFMAGDVRIYVKGEVSHHAHVVSMGAPDTVAGSTFLKYVIRYIDTNPAGYFQEPVSDFLTRETLLQRYSAHDLCVVRLYSDVVFGDPAFGGQSITMPLSPAVAVYFGVPLHRWKFTFENVQVPGHLAVGDTVNIDLSGTVNLYGRSGQVMSIAASSISVLTDISGSMLGEDQLYGTDAAMRWGSGMDFYTSIMPVEEYSDVEEQATELDGLKKPSTVYGQKAWKVTLFVNRPDYMMLRKYLQVLTGDNGTVTLILPGAGMYQAVERIKPVIEEIDTGLFKVSFLLKYAHEVFNIYNY